MSAHNSHSTSFAVGLLLFAVLTQTGCERASQAPGEGVGLLPGPPEGEIPFSKYEPERPYVQLAPNLLARTLHEAVSEAGYRVEVQDLLVGPNRSVANVSLPGAAILEIRSGNGVLTASGKSQEIHTGSTLALSGGEAFSIENKVDIPIAMMAHVFMAQ